MGHTIVALATPPGRSGIGVIRLSGPHSLQIAGRLTLDAEFNPPARRAVLKKLYDPQTDEIIDEALVTYFKAPESFTGEDVVEISCHGSPILLRQIIDFCLSLDARLAQPGEFSLRALSNARMDLSQAEAVRDLIDAQTVASARQAVRQLRGELSHQLQALKEELLNIIVVLESTLEFVEDDLPQFQIDTLRRQLVAVIGKLKKMSSTYQAGRLLREGIKVAIAGRPNVGKSSLFNALVGYERAIVTDIAGTTRDSLHETLSIKGIPVFLIDTAGLSRSEDSVERIGVDRSRRIVADADLVLVILDDTQELTEEDLQVLSDTESLKRLFVLNKIDLNLSKLDVSEFLMDAPYVRISALDGSGLGSLQEAIVSLFLPGEVSDSNFLISDSRHFDLLRRTVSELENSANLLEEKVSEEIVLIGLHNAMTLLGEISGETTAEDVLTKIFSTFCIGK